MGSSPSSLENEKMSRGEETLKDEGKKETTSGAGAGSEEASGESWSSWFSTNLASAKEKSTEMLQYLKQDLSEFGESVQEAGRDLKDKLKLEDTAKTAVSSMGSKVNTILEQVSTIFGVSPEDDEETTMYIGRNGPVVISRTEVSSLSVSVLVSFNDL